ncbi:MAG: orotidine-5'-phosphate decarboxylase [Candidatus Micrarchaeota archaeon]|nr:orotidine-5'-phosphate decarboxylase [Candidatus Micrarchaeota archaeon]MDE1833863.1 orotidine-5'-phosphate decarboxylase [Candidatus Micrarchaeota archaeon]MDE1859350.1 orotidine-5'-phosphate decarboxylase [Candidatus Micrarchaeota archaeon]
MSEKRVILSLDITDEPSALRLAEQLEGEIFAIKIGLASIIVNGGKYIRDMSSYAKVICDFKSADIPKTNAQIAQKALEYNAWGIIVQAFTGKDAIKASVDVSDRLKVFSLVSMTHEGASYFIDKHVEEMAKISIEAGVYGIVAPGNRPETLAKVRKLVGEKKIISPGIGVQGGDPITAIKNGSDYVIIGRTIYESKDPLGTVKEINRAISAVIR